jgi:hypothetical protein
VFESKDGRVSWKQVSSTTDKVNGWGIGAQPAVMEITQDLGLYKKDYLASAVEEPTRLLGLARSSMALFQSLTPS